MASAEVIMPGNNSNTYDMDELNNGGESGMREACGLFGIVATGDWPADINLSHLIHLGLVGLQHRGQESAGIVTTNGGPNDPFVTRKAMGLVNSAFSKDDIATLQGNLGIGHVRYSTCGTSDVTHIQPFVVECLHGLIAVAHNGELVNVKSLKQKLLRHGVGLSTGSDSELITQLLTHMPDCGEPHGANWVGSIYSPPEKVTKVDFTAAARGKFAKFETTPRLFRRCEPLQ
ncbi:Amidophosphoribosyltransferase [Plakobranchus ocellatus]|uniref:Amidophosphoribosyltransferase n=1 Tax=Plakobranchus ocellatus TaxID=259542 RepID=A0AAV3YF45_9GAST|nr:Amidophosphoribosyltransferase [Plakobranchus ocellatus]